MPASSRSTPTDSAAQRDQGEPPLWLQIEMAAIRIVGQAGFAAAVLGQAHCGEIDAQRCAQHVPERQPGPPG